jgi:hypothetical protein
MLFLKIGKTSLHQNSISILQNFFIRNFCFTVHSQNLSLWLEFGTHSSWSLKKHFYQFHPNSKYRVQLCKNKTTNIK